MGCKVLRLIIIGSILVLLGCATVHEGSDLTDEKIEQIKIGATRKDRIIALFGQPQQQGLGYIAPVPPDLSKTTHTNRVPEQRSNSPREGETLIYIDATKVIRAGGLVEYSERSLNVYLVNGVVSECILARTHSEGSGTSRQERRCDQTK